MGSNNKLVFGCLANNNNNQLEIELTQAGNKLLHFASFKSLFSTQDIITILLQTENNLSTLPQLPPKSLIEPLHQINNALIAKELMRHPDMNVNISVASCICEILRITAPKVPYNNEQIKDFFEVVVMSFDKLSSVSGGYYGKMTKVIEVFSKARLPILMLYLQQDGHGLFVRLFKHFVNVSDFNPTAIVVNMENIMRMVVEESDKLAIELQHLLFTSIRKDNQSGSPVCWEFGQKVLMICAAKLKPIDRRSITVFDYPEMVAIICKTTSDKGSKEIIPFTTEPSKMHKIKLEYPETINGKRKRNNEQAPFVEHGQILVGRKIRVWRPKDEIYRPGVVKSFDCLLKRHKVLFDDGFEVVIDLKIKRWMLEKLSAIPDSSLVLAEPAPREVSSLQSAIICAQGYKVKSINAPILEEILKKHGDIASTCVFTDAAIRTALLEGVCDIVRRIETSDVTTFISSIKEIESQVFAAEAAKINVSWLRASLNAIHKRNEAGKKVTVLMDLKSNTTLVKRAARTDRKERHAKLVAAQNQFAEAERCVEVLKLVEKKLNSDVLESMAEKDLWAQKSVI